MAYSILVIDDDRSILTLIGTVALAEGFDVVTTVDAEAQHVPAGWLADGRLLLLTDGQLNVGLTDPVQVRGIVASGLEQQGIRTVMASGDRTSVASQVAAEVGTDECRAELTPDLKIELIRELQSQGHVVAMVGDGSNDAPALAQADVGIAMARGTAVARATADITLLRPDVTLVPTALGLSQRTLRVIKQNLFWAFGYNVAALPLAMSGNFNPMIAGIAMSASSVLVVSNSLRLR